MINTMAVQVCYNSWYISLPCSAKQQLETAVSTKVVPQKRKSVLDNADW